MSKESVARLFLPPLCVAPFNSCASPDWLEVKLFSRGNKPVRSLNEGVNCYEATTRR